MKDFLPDMPPTVQQLEFLAMAGVSVLTAIGVIVLKSPVRAALLLVVNFFVLAFIYFGLNAQLLGITQILVYAGAIMVLFLFVVMLLTPKQVDISKPKFDVKPVFGGIFGITLFGLLSSQVLPTLTTRKTVAADDFGAPQSIGRVLFIQYGWAIEVTSVLLLIGIVGSIMLAKRKV